MLYEVITSKQTKTAIRKMPMRKPKLNRDFTIYARSSEAPTYIEDSSFEYFKSNLFNSDNYTFDLNAKNRREEKGLEEDELKFALFANINRDPTSYKDAMNTREKYDWQSSTLEEPYSIKENDVWVLVDRPNVPKSKIIDSKWIQT